VLSVVLLTWRLGSRFLEAWLAWNWEGAIGACRLGVRVSIHDSSIFSGLHRDDVYEQNTNLTGTDTG